MNAVQMQLLNGLMFYEKFVELLPCPHNRKTDRAKVKEIKKAIESTGEVKPFVVCEVFTDHGARLMITDGHHRHEAMLDLIAGGRFRSDCEVPCVFSAGAEGIRSADRHDKSRVNAQKTGDPIGYTELKPITDLNSYHKEAQAAAEKAMYEWLYEPILAAIWASGLRNAKTSALVSAVESGRIRYDKGRFVGEFSGAVSAELRSLGATWEPKWKSYGIKFETLPANVRMSIADYARRASNAAARIERLITGLQEKGLPPIDFSGEAGPILSSLEKQLKKTTSDAITIEPIFTPAMADNFKRAYTESLNYYIQNWSQEAAVRLREKMAQGALAGFRAESMEAIVEGERAMSNRRTRFIARQETSLLVSKFRQERYQDLGLVSYRWSTSHDERVRQDHKDLNGHVFQWSNPPIVDKNTGRRGNPGEDYGCRCVAIPVIRGAYIAKGDKK